jgi:DNA-binding CsgD family transcriptional regulator
MNPRDGSIIGSLDSFGSMCFGAIAAGDLATLRTHTVEVAAVLRNLGGTCEEPGWLWWSGVALASGEARSRSALRLAGAADAVGRRDGLHLHEQLRRQVQPWLERARAEVGSAKADHLAVEGSQLSSDELIDEALREADHSRSSPLSSRELEVADLVAKGLTNREIAQRLVISTRTVESHVEHIKAKLGFGRRARIVAWALDQASDQRGACVDESEKLPMTGPACGVRIAAVSHSTSSATAGIERGPLTGAAREGKRAATPPWC